LGGTLRRFGTNLNYSENGGATKVSPSSWADDKLSDLFGTKYSKDIATYYPYDPTSTDSSNPSESAEPNKGGGGGLPLWVGPVLGVLLGLIATCAVLIAWIYWRRRRRFRRSSYGPSEGGRIENSNRVLKWMYGTKASAHKSDYTTTSTEIGGTEKPLPGFRGSDAGVISPSTPGVVPARAIGGGRQEADAENQLHEMPGWFTFLVPFPRSFQHRRTNSSLFWEF
jgi:hypothetical protein